MPIAAKYVHTNLTARDWRGLVRFYCEVFGCIPRPPERDLSGSWLDRLTSLGKARLRGLHLALPGHGPGGPTLEIFTYDSMVAGKMPQVNQPGLGHIAFQVEDVKAALATVVRAGGGQVGAIAATNVPGAGSLEVVYARDPEGNIIELQKWEP